MGKLIKGYARLFEQGKREDSEGDIPANKAGFVEHWGWYHTLDNMSNNDRTKWDYFLNMNVIAFLNYLAYEKDKQLHIQEQTKLIERGSR